MSIIHQVGEEQLTLLSDRAIYIAARKLLLISDLHLGKIDHFRKWGIGVPARAAVDNYVRLQDLLVTVEVERVIFLGDLFHSDMNQDWARFTEFLMAFPHISFELVMGNHDVFAQRVYEDQLHAVYPETVQIGSLLLSHEPQKGMPAGCYNLCGHIHPGYVLRGRGRQRLRLPCYFFGERLGILPAFGTFTGLYIMESKEEDQVYVIADGSVLTV